MSYSKESITYFIISTFYPSGEPILPHLLCCSGFAVKDHSFILCALHMRQPQLVNNSGKLTWFLLLLFCQKMAFLLLFNNNYWKIMFKEKVMKLFGDIWFHYRFIIIMDTNFINLEGIRWSWGYGLSDIEDLAFWWVFSRESDVVGRWACLTHGRGELRRRREKRRGMALKIWSEHKPHLNFIFYE